MELNTDSRKIATKGARMVLTNPGTGEEMQDADGKSAALILAGKDSDQYRKAEDAVNRKWQEEGARSRKFRVTPAMIRAGELQKLVACTLGWENCSYSGTSEFSPEVAKALYEGEPWVLEQAMTFVDDRSVFLTASTTHS